MSFTYDLRLVLPGKGIGTQDDPCDFGSVIVKVSTVDGNMEGWNGNAYKGRYLSQVDPLYPTSPWNWFNHSVGSWQANWEIRPVHKDAKLQVTVTDVSGAPTASQSFWLRKGIPPAYFNIVTSGGLMPVLIAPTFHYLKEAGIIQYAPPRWKYVGSKAALQSEIDAIPEIIYTIYALDGDIVVNMNQRVLLEEERLTFYNASLEEGKRWTTVGPVSKNVLVEALDGYVPPPIDPPIDPPVDPPPEPEPPDPTFPHVFPLGLRTTEGIDCGIKVTALHNDTTVHICIYKSVEPLHLPAELVGGPYIYTLGMNNAVAKMCKHHYNIPEADSAIVMSNKPVSGEVVWMVPKSWEHEYVGLPGIEPL